MASILNNNNNNKFEFSENIDTISQSLNSLKQPPHQNHYSAVDASATDGGTMTRKRARLKITDPLVAPIQKVSVPNHLLNTSK